ncbi:MAG: hypothetical protein HY567_03790 [Candidatus Kerfeldbacteria bacterium]|nr:hypothetical protein [Candidatus Kerfeldbacteria bacterium]
MAMAVRRRGRILLSVALGALVFGVQAAQAVEVSVSAGVIGTTPPGPQNPVVEFRGLAAPRAALTVTRNSSTVGQTTADDAASFAVTASDQSAGQYEFVVAGKDGDGRVLTSVSFTLNLTAGTTTIVTGVFLGPSIALDKTTVTTSESVSASGATAPGSSVTVTVTSEPKTYTALADSNGRWQVTIKGADVGEGSHNVKARAIANGVTASAFSASVSFSVSAEPTPAPSYKPSDINQDTKVNLIDFSIMLFYWQQRNPANPRVDLNGDGIVNIVDFSILLYEWTG